MDDLIREIIEKYSDMVLESAFIFGSRRLGANANQAAGAVSFQKPQTTLYFSIFPFNTGSQVKSTPNFLKVLRSTSESMTEICT